MTDAAPADPPGVHLTNEMFAFSSNCFVCEPTNGDGLRMQFFHDEETSRVRSSFALSDAFSGAPSYVHGGVSLAVLDEVQAWATIAIGGKFAVTSRTEVDFLKPVRVGKEYIAEAEIIDTTDDVMHTVGRIRNHRDEVCVEGRSVFIVLSAAKAIDAIGDVSGDDRSFLKD